MPVVTEKYGPILVVRIDREAKRNAINREIALGIEDALNTLESTPSLRAGVITGTTTVFSAGTDLKDGHGASTVLGGEYGIIRRRRTKPLIAAVEGPALGGGFEIVLACDLIVASQSAVFALPESLRGVVPNAGAMFRAASALPRNVATRMMLTGEPLGPQRCLELGLVNEITETGHAVKKAIQIAEAICRAAPTSITQILTAQQSLRDPAEEQGWRATASAVEVITASEDMHEGRAAFFEKRTPQWPTAEKAILPGTGVGGGES